MIIAISPSRRHDQHGERRADDRARRQRQVVVPPEQDEGHRREGERDREQRQDEVFSRTAAAG